MVLRTTTNHDWAQIERFLASADKKLASARKILAFDEEACLQQAYEVMINASGFMFSHGFRARNQAGHPHRYHRICANTHRQEAFRSADRL
jgi:hypothetical protein